MVKRERAEIERASVEATERRRRVDAL